MSKTEHTRGPWQARTTDDGCEVIKTPQSLTDRYAPVHICDCTQDAGEGEIHPDAYLIAAAPELLGHLEFAVKLLTGMPFGATAQVEAMRDAIAKAKGENR